MTNQLDAMRTDDAAVRRIITEVMQPVMAELSMIKAIIDSVHQPSLQVGQLSEVSQRTQNRELRGVQGKNRSGGRQ